MIKPVEKTQWLVHRGKKYWHKENQNKKHTVLIQTQSSDLWRYLLMASIATTTRTVFKWFLFSHHKNVSQQLNKSTTYSKITYYYAVFTHWNCLNIQLCVTKWNGLKKMVSLSQNEMLRPKLKKGTSIER